MRSEISIKGCQIKSKETLRTFCAALDQLEKTIGIKSVRISFEDLFICPDIDLTEYANSADPMEKLVGNLLIKLNPDNYKDTSE